MATSLDTIRTITIKALGDGFDPLIAKLKALGDAQQDVTVKSDNSTKSQLSVADAYNRQTLRVNDAANAQAKVAAQMVIANRAFDQGLLGDKNSAEAKALLASRMDQIIQKYGQLTPATDKTSGATLAMQEAMNQARGAALGLAAGIGPVGAVLGSLGPVGVVVAAGLGLIVAAFEEAKRTAHLLAEEAVSLQKFAELTGLSTSTLQALTQAAAKHGVSAEEATNSIVKFTTAWAEARDGGGTFLVQLQKIAPGLADQIQRTKDSATAFDLLTKAIQAADAAGDIARRNQLLRAAGGRGGVAALTGISAAAGDAGGLGNLTQDAIDAGTAINDKLLKDVQHLKTEIDDLNKHADMLMGSVGAKPILESEKAWAELRVSMANTVVELAKGEATMGPWDRFFAQVQRYQNGLDLTPLLRPPPPALSGAEPSAVWGPSQTAPSAVQPKDIKAQLADLREQNSLLGTAATANERLTQRLLELKAAVAGNATEENKLAAIRGEAAARLDTAIAIESKRISALGAAATPTELLAQKTQILAKDLAEGAITQQTYNRALGDAQKAFVLTNMQAMISALGAAATPTEQLTVKLAALRLEYDRGKISQDTLTRSSAQARLEAGAATLQINEQLGLATAESVRTQKLAELYAMLGKVKLNQDQYTQAIATGSVSIQKDIEATQKQMEVRAAALPGLKGMAIDSGDLRTQLDLLSTTSMTNITSNLADITMGTVTASQGFTNLGLAVLRSLDEMLIKMLIVKPIADSLNASLGGGGILSFLGLGGGASATSHNPALDSARGNIFENGRITPFKMGDIIAQPMIFPMANGMGLAGEAGPEAIMPLKRGTDGRLGVAGGGGGGGQTIQIVSHYDLTGAVDKDELSAMIKTSHAQAVQQAIAITRSAAPGRMDSYNKLGS